MRGTYTRSIVGSVVFEALGGATLMTYSNLFAAAVSFPGIENKELAEVRTSASVLVKQVEKEHQGALPQLRAQIAKLRAALQ